MSIIAVLAAVKALAVCASWSKRPQERRQAILMGGESQMARSIPLIDNHLKRATNKSTKTEVFVAKQLAAFSRQIVHTRAFDYVLLQLIHSGIRKQRSKSNLTKPEVVL
jgi:hypothetical protein